MRTWDGEKTVSFTDPQYGTFEVKHAERFLLNGEEIPFAAQNGFHLTKTKLISAG